MTPTAPPESGAPSVERILDRLTDEQHAAVSHAHGPLLIVAGAGTGKTTVITRRVAWLIASRLARPEEILALTFTDKAAREMEERVDLLVPYGYVDLRISTFHAFGYQVLRDHALDIGLDPNLVVLSRPQQIIFLREQLFDLPLERYRPLGDPTRWLSALVALIGRAKDEDVSPQAYLRHARSLREAAAAQPGDVELADEAAAQGELAGAYEAYQQRMAARGYIDFGDQVYRVLQLFRERPAVLQAFQRRFKFILVDEFQDTNHAQFELIRLLAGQHGNLTVVGDDDQAIYRFRGAAISNILQFVEHYPTSRQVVLTKNFRSPQSVLDASYRLIQRNNPDRLEVRNRIDKRLVSNRPEGPLPVHRVFDTTSSEADEVARMIAEAGRPASDFCILVRGNRDADPYLRALNMRGIAFRFTGSQGLYARAEVRLLLDFLRVVADPADSVSMYQLACSDVYGVDPLSLAVVSGVASRRHLAMYDVMRMVATPDEASRGKLAERDGVALAGLDAATRDAVARILDDVRTYVEMAATRSPGQVLYQFLKASGLLERYARQERPDDDVCMQNIARFFDVVRSYELLDERARLPQLVRHLDLLMEAGDSPAVVEADPDDAAVSVLTVHKSKGLEFPVVFVVGCVDGKFPPRQRAEPLSLPDELARHLGTGGSAVPGLAEPDRSGSLRCVQAKPDPHLQEERRLFYVAMTRAREELYLFAARDAGGRRARKTSPFVGEALDLERADVSAARASAAEMIARFAEPVRLPPGEEAPVPDDRVLTLSHKQLDDYLTCPLKYKYVHVLRVPLMSHHSVIYGRALHEAISFYNKSKQDGASPPLEEVLGVLDRAWVNEGFLSREHEEQRCAQARRVLGEWYARQEVSPRVPFLVEQEFAFAMGRDKIVGRFDRVDRWDGGAAIVDYKSTDVRTQDDADKRARDNLQLSVYALAYAERFGELPDYVELQFLESGVCGRARKTERDLAQVRELIAGAARGVRRRDYAPTPEFRACQVCAFHDMCPAVSRG